MSHPPTINVMEANMSCVPWPGANRYMHSPNEMIQMSDVEHAARLIATFVQSLTTDTDFIPR